MKSRSLKGVIRATPCRLIGAGALAIAAQLAGCGDAADSGDSRSTTSSAPAVEPFGWNPSEKAIPSGSPPPTPTGLVVTAGDRVATLSWNASPGARYYTVYIRGAPDADFRPALTTYRTRVGLRVLNNGTTYLVRMSASNDAGSSDFSDTLSVTPQAAPQR